jgi:hypothetical protein
LRLAKAGYFGGDPGAVKRGSVNDVLNALAFESFANEYAETEYELNKA